MLQAGATLPAPPVTTSSGGTESASCQKLRKKKRFNLPAVSAYEGKCEEIKHHVYDVIPGKSGFDIFAKTTTEIGEYIAWTVPNAGEFTLVVRLDELSFPVIPAPPLLTVRNDLWRTNGIMIFWRSERKISRWHMPLFGASAP
jgi:hypothetical protein